MLRVRVICINLPKILRLFEPKPRSIVIIVVTHISRLTLPAIVVLFVCHQCRSQIAQSNSRWHRSNPTPQRTGVHRRGLGQPSFTSENTSLRKCIALAYNVSEDRDNAISAPDWLNFERYDIAAKFPAGTPLEQVRVMLQNLLADRFKLKLHRESKELPIYALVAAKNGPKLTESAPGTQGSIGMSQGHLSGKERACCCSGRSAFGSGVSIRTPGAGSYRHQRALRLYAGLGTG